MLPHKPPRKIRAEGGVCRLQSLKIELEGDNLMVIILNRFHKTPLELFDTHAEAKTEPPLTSFAVVIKVI